MSAEPGTPPPVLTTCVVRVAIEDVVGAAVTEDVPVGALVWTVPPGCAELPAELGYTLFPRKAGALPLLKKLRRHQRTTKL